jgi:methionine synthase / methylenetetrahydrofolate reductase(NADPH)
MDNYDLVPSGLIKLIKHGFNTGVDHAGATIGQPTSFFVGSALNVNPPDLDTEIKTLRRKLRAGADFFLTQPVYDAALVLAFLERYASEYGKFPVPLIIGILPLASARHAAFLAQEVPGITIPAEILERMNQAGEHGAQMGIQIAGEIIEELRPATQGIYLMPAFNRFDYAAEIIENARNYKPV